MDILGTLGCSLHRKRDSSKQWGSSIPFCDAILIVSSSSLFFAFPFLVQHNHHKILRKVYVMFYFYLIDCGDLKSWDKKGLCCVLFCFNRLWRSWIWRKDGFTFFFACFNIFMYFVLFFFPCFNIVCILYGFFHVNFILLPL